ncbi:MAG TPA: hypothetical protein VI072_30285 [Polyangiaceae bacterium]
MIWRRVLGSVAFLTLASACFDPKIPTCLSCPTGECPSGQQCVQGRCTARGETCASETPETCADGRCCIGDACLDASGSAAPLLWLDWTSLRPSDAPSGTPLELWFDRSGFEHHAAPFGNTPVIGPSTESPTRVLRMPAGNEALLAAQPLDSRLRQLGSRDILVLVAASLSCNVTQDDYCFAVKWGEPYANSGLGLRGFQLRAISRDEATAVFRGDTTWSARTSGLGLGCEQFHLFGLRRVLGASRLELRLDGRVVAETDIPADADGSTAPTPYSLGGFGPCETFQGEMAASVVVDAALTDQQTCELERFLLTQLSDAGLVASGAVPECP